MLYEEKIIHMHNRKMINIKPMEGDVDDRIYMDTQKYFIVLPAWQMMCSLCISLLKLYLHIKWQRQRACTCRFTSESVAMATAVPGWSQKPRVSATSLMSGVAA